MKKTIALNGFEIVQDGETVPAWVKLIPAGEVVGRDGRGWRNSEPDRVVNHFRELGRDLPIDIEHSTEHKAPKGEPAPAVGWIKELVNRGGEIWGRSEWNSEGQKMVGGKAYRYLSPVIIYQPKSGIIAGVTSVAVTNQPNFRLPALNHEQGSELPEEETMWKALLSALGLSENATEAEAVAKVGTIKAELSTALNRAENPSLERFVPRADYEAAVAKAANAEQKLTAIEEAQHKDKVDTAINQALQDGKITPATADYYRKQCNQEGGLEMFVDFCKTAPVIGGNSGLGGREPEGGGKALNATEQQVIANLGISKEEYLKAAV